MLHLEELARLQLSKHARDLNAVEKRFGARGRIFRFMGPSVSTSRGSMAEDSICVPFFLSCYPHNPNGTRAHLR